MIGNTSLVRLFKTTFVLFTCLASILLFSSVEANAASSTISTYIQKKCKSNCVDPSLLTMVAEKIGQEFNIEPLILVAIASVESRFNSKALNTKSGRSVGLMQIQVFWHKKKFQTGNYFDVFDNMRVGAIVYKECMDKWKGSRDKALWCYNGHTPTGMKVYVPKVLAELRQLSNMNLFSVNLQKYKGNTSPEFTPIPQMNDETNEPVSKPLVWPELIPHSEEETPEVIHIDISLDHRSFDALLTEIHMEFPHIADNLELLIGHPEFEVAIGKLIVDERGGRQGFPKHIMAALLKLSDLHTKEHGHMSLASDPWHSVAKAV